MPLLTLGIPVYNGMPYLKETMGSIFAQKFKNFKILVINDGSTDDTTEYLNSLRDSRLRIISQENRGLTSTLNRMLYEIDTPWLARQDADDIAFPERLGMLNEWAMEKPHAGLFYSRAVHYQDGKRMLELQTTTASPERLRELTRAGHLLSICHSTVALNVRKLLAVGGYRFDRYVEDYDMYWRMALESDLHCVPDILVGARVGARGISGQNIKRQTLNMIWVQYLLMSHILGVKPYEYDEAAKRLENLLAPGMVNYRLQMRLCLQRIGEGKRAQAAAHFARASGSCPSLIVRRLARVLRNHKEIVLGVEPYIFKQKMNYLWPIAQAS